MKQSISSWKKSQNVKFFSYISVIFLITMLFGCQESNQNDLFRKKPIDEPNVIELPSNSFSDHFVDSDINYQYVVETETHDYSGNWDFDGDGINDSIRFVGNGGAHLYHAPVIKLSSNSIEQKFEWLSTDFPLLQPVDSLNKNVHRFSLVNFVVHDFDNDQLLDIFIQIDRTNKLPSKFNHVKPEDRKFVVYFNKKSKSLIVDEWTKVSKNSASN